MTTPVPPATVEIPGCGRKNRKLDRGIPDICAIKGVRYLFDSRRRARAHLRCRDASLEPGRQAEHGEVPCRFCVPVDCGRSGKGATFKITTCDLEARGEYQVLAVCLERVFSILKPPRLPVPKPRRSIGFRVEEGRPRYRRPRPRIRQHGEG